MAGRINREWKANDVTQHLRYAGADQAIGNYSGGAVDFSYTPTRDVFVMHLAVVLQDVGTFDSGFYGNNIVLTNGIRFVIKDADGTEVKDIMDGHVVHTNGDWVHHAEDLTLHAFGQGNPYLTAHFEFWNQVGVPLHLPANHSINMVLHDDFTGLVEHEFLLKGVAI